MESGMFRRLYQSCEFDSCLFSEGVTTRLSTWLSHPFTKHITNITTAMRTEWKLLSTDENAAESLRQALGIHPVLCRLLVQRGIHSFEQAKAFFRPSLDDLHDPFLMQDMDAAVQRLRQAIEKGEKILLYGDYDVDGTCSIALMYSFLEKLHPHLDYYIPDRYREGYGVSMEGIEYARENAAALIIAMDCGITAIDQVRRANAYGIDFIICDHHLPGDVLPEALAVLDPQRADCPYPYKELSGCGVAFKLAQAYSIRYGVDASHWQSLLDFLVISIAADIVPMTGENRVLAWYGLQQLNRSDKPGLNALIEESRRSRPLNVSDIVFGLAPMINAAGRMADAGQAVRLMLAQDHLVAAEYSRVLEYRNQLRREYDLRTFEEAEAMPAAHDETRRSIVLYGPHWHKGVVGIVASRIVERCHKPAILLTHSDGMAVGSARSVAGFDLHAALGQCRDLLKSYGGHAHAAGLSLLPENVQAFSERFEAVVRQSLSEDDIRKVISVHAEIDLQDITPAFGRVLKQFAPFGPGNRNPVFVTKQVSDTGYSRLLKGDHLKLLLRQGERSMSGIAFGQGEALTKGLLRRPFDVCYTLEESQWDERREWELMVKDMRAGGEEK